MENQNNVPLLGMIKRNWFQLALIGMVLFVLLRKDFSVQFNLNNPVEMEQDKAPRNASKKKKSLLTEKQGKREVAKAETSLFNTLPLIGGGSMKKKKSELSDVPEATIESYIRRFAHVANSERKKYGIPSSIIVANALYHSFAGQRDIALHANNHFGITCTSDWNGGTQQADNNCYRSYENAWTSFRDHSLYVTTGKFSSLRQYGTTDYKAWARGLESLQFSNLPKLESNLIRLIEKYQLQQLDHQ